MRRTSLLNVAYIWIRFWRKHGRVLNLFAPKRYNEKIQWRKLFDLNPIYAQLSDKAALREFVSGRIGPERLVPVLWLGEDPEAIPFESLLTPYVIKCTHGHGMNIFVDEPAHVDRGQTKAQLRRWFARDHGRALVEPGHVALPPRVMIESMLRDENNRAPTEYKFFLFDGRTALVAIRLNEDHFKHSNLFVTPDWQRTPIKFDMPRFDGPMPPTPTFFEEMRSLAERLGAGFDHIRVDFLATGQSFFIGEVSLYPHSGMVPVDPDFYDEWLGRQWRLEGIGRRALAALLGRRSPSTSC